MLLFFLNYLFDQAIEKQVGMKPDISIAAADSCKQTAEDIAQHGPPEPQDVIVEVSCNSYWKYASN